MFNIDQRTQLSDCNTWLDEIVRDAGFFAVGKIPTRVPARLVPVGSGKFIGELETEIDGIAAVICTAELVDQIPEHLGCAVAENPLRAAFFIHEMLCAQAGYYWGDFATKIAPDAEVHPTAYVAEKNVVIGAGTFVGPNAVVQQRSIIGERCRIGAGTVIGSEAFEIVQIDGMNKLQAHGGGVRLGNDVVFCSNSAVARSIYPTFTDIGDNCGFDNLVHVAHDCVLEAGCKMTACSMLSGRVDLKAGAYIGPNSTISNGLVIGEKGLVTIGSTVIRDVEAGARVTGNFAIEHKRFMRNLKASIS